MPWQNAGTGPGRGADPDGIVRRSTVFVLLTVLAAWLMSGLFALNENEQAAVFRLGKFHRVVGQGMHWTLPYPIETYAVLSLSESGSVVIGASPAAQETGLQDAQLLTSDGYIAEVRLVAQYRIQDPAQYFLNQAVDAEYLVKQAGASALREVLAGMPFSELVSGHVDDMARRVQPRLQAALDATGSGIAITSLKAGADAVRTPGSLQSAYEKVYQARQEKEQAAAQAASAASQALAALELEAASLREEALSYQRRVVADARAESEQFALLLPEYQKAPQATRERLYYDTMQQVFGRMRKVVIDGRPGQSIHISLDNKTPVAAKPASAAAIPGSAAHVASAAAVAGSQAVPVQNAVSTSEASSENNLRSRDPAKLRQRP